MPTAVKLPYHQEPKPQKDTSVIYAGDCYHILTAGDNYIADASVDLIYIDPPWNTSEEYVTFWKDSLKVMSFADNFKSVKDYIDYMEERVNPLVRKLKPTGSFYFHCDYHASHYVKQMLDGLLGEANFRSEIIWKRTSAHNDAGQGRKQYGNIHDSIFFYSRSANWTWNTQYTPYDEDYVKKFYRHTDPDGRRYRLSDMTGRGGAAKGNPEYEVMGVTRHWAFSKESMAQLIADGRVVQSRAGVVPQQKRYLDEMPGVSLQSIWTDIRPLSHLARERLGYPTQKPVSLLERIIRTSSNEGDVVLDAFCGCGSTIEAAHKLGRKWIGIDISHAACRAVAERLETRMALLEGKDFIVWGTDLQYMTEAAIEGMHANEFETWVINQLQAQGNAVKVGDGGIDGRYYPIDKITYQQLLKKHEPVLHQETIFGADYEKVMRQIYNYRPIQVKKMGKAIGRDGIAAFRESMQQEKCDVGYYVSLKGFTRGGINAIKRLYKEENLTIVPATPLQMIEFGTQEVQRIHAAPIMFEAYLSDFEKKVAA